MKASQKIAVILKNNNQSVREFANAIGVSPGRIYHIMHSRTQTISFELAMRICRAFPQYHMNMMLMKDDDLWLEETENGTKGNRMSPEIAELRARIAELEEEVARCKQMLIDKDKIIALMETKNNRAGK